MTSSRLPGSRGYAIMPSMRGSKRGSIGHNLPAPLATFVGREREIADVKRLLVANRLVTLTGTGGVGKTRLAVRIAADLVSQYAGGVWLVELAELADASLVPDKVALALRLQPRGGRDSVELVREHVGSRPVLLVLDNCEHVIDPAAQLALGLLEACPGLRIIATSREALSLTGEATFLVPSLSIPDLTDPATIEASEAVRLFTERARAALPAFRLQPNARAVAAICRRLDGVPLAIELAAARVPTLAVAEIAARLNDGFRLLSSDGRSSVPRHQTLRATVDWSHDLLSPTERVLFRRLSVFAGGWALDAAEAVCAGDGLERAEVLDLLTGLAAKSLVVADVHGVVARYRLLETVRHYAAERLTGSGEAEAVQRQHGLFFLSFAEAAEPHLWGPGQAAWLDRLERDHDNLRGAIRWFIEAGETQLALRLTVAVWRFWDVRGHLAEGSRRLEEAIALASAPTQTQVKAVLGLAFLARDRGDHPAAVSLAEQSLELFAQAEDEHGMARARAFLGAVVGATDPERSAALLEEAFASLLALGDELHAAYALLNLALTRVRDRSSEARVREMLEECLVRFQRVGDRTGIAWALGMLGERAASAGDDERAGPLYEQSLSHARVVDDRRVLAWILGLLGDLERRGGQWDRAAGHLRESLGIAQELGDPAEIGAELLRLAALAHARGQHTRAARLLGAADSAGERSRTSSPAPADALRDRVTKGLRAVLGAGRFASVRDDGRALPLEQVIEDVLNDAANAGHRSTRSPKGRPGAGRLTARETEVAALVMRGLTNRQIAERLVLSERTVDAHLERIRSRLGVRSRTEIAAWMLELDAATGSAG